MRARVAVVRYDAPYDSPDKNRTRCDQARVRHLIRVDFSRIIRSRPHWHQLRRKYRRVRCGNRNDHPTSWFGEVSGGCSGDRIRRILQVVRSDRRWAKREVCCRLSKNLGSLVRVPPAFNSVGGTKPHALEHANHSLNAGHRRRLPEMTSRTERGKSDHPVCHLRNKIANSYAIEIT